jgi:DMATS type aromatic prenyltransferase
MSVPRGEHKTWTSTDLDLNGDTVEVKAYFFPILKALATGRSPESIVWDAVAGLSIFSKALEPLKRYLDGISSLRRPTVEMIAIDCVDPESSRIKVYWRTLGISLNHVRDMYLLGGKIASEKNLKAIEGTEEIWPLLFDTETHATRDDKLEQKRHRISGICSTSS